MKSHLITKTTGQGKNIALLHGWGVNSGVWQTVSKQLEERYRVTYIDLPGFGLNAGHMPKNYNLESIAKMVSECLPNKTNLIGWSLGGLVAQKIALEKMADIEKLILLATSPKFQKRLQWPGIEPKVLTIFEQQLSIDYSKTLDRFLAIQAMGSASAKLDIKQIKQSIAQYPTPNIQALKAGLQILEDTDLRSQLSQLAIPSHWMLGKLDSLVPFRIQQRLELILPNATYSVFSKASHAPFVSHPKEFLSELTNVFE